MQHNKFRNTLTKWYLANQRVLPWRQTSDPYAIWVSEIILQQTRINQGLDYYYRFISRFPDIHTLAKASEELVLKTWEGLGYYSRARNMHATARTLLEIYGGKFPEDPKELEKLKGIGKYTAAAIASIAFGKPAAVVDGNVIRFITRYYGIEAAIDASGTIKQINHLANELITEDSPGLFNQAMMEFGALQCIPANPDCQSCPFNETCVSYKKGKVAVIPAKSKKTKISARYFNYLFVRTRQNGSSVMLLKKRSDNDIWKHLYDFPLIEADKLLSKKQLEDHAVFKSLFASYEPKVDVCHGSYRHLLTHRIIHARFFSVSIPENDGISFLEDFIHVDDLSRYPLPKLINNFLTDQGLVYGRETKG
jgi:A/G-specific adenine glycosylase